LKQFLALFLFLLFATIALPIRGTDSFSNNIVEEENVAKNKAASYGLETFHFGDEFLAASTDANFHYHYAVALFKDPSFSVLEQPPNSLV
jgi:hypothetical protein